MNKYIVISGKKFKFKKWFLQVFVAVITVLLFYLCFIFANNAKVSDTLSPETSPAYTTDKNSAVSTSIQSNDNT